MINIAQDVENLLDNERSYPCHTNRASAMGHPCTRNLVYMRTSWDKAASIDTFLQGIFATGNILEGPIGRIISEAGEKATTPWRIVGGQQAIADKLLKDHQITGHIDGLLQRHTIVSAGVGGVGREWQTVAVADVKTCSDYTFDSISREADLLKDRDSFFFKWWVQMQIYMLGMGYERAVLVLVRKSNLFQIKTIEFGIDLEEGERQLQRAKEINEAVTIWNDMDEENRQDALPDKINRPKVCNKCPFVQICNPKLELDVGETFDDAETEALLDRRAELAEGKSEFTRIDKDLKAALPTGELVKCGKWHIHGTLVSPVDKKTYWKRTYELVPVLPTT